MKKFISTVQNLSARAAQLQAAIQSAPPKFAELREAITMTGGQLQQLRSEVEQGINELKADNEVLLMDSLREINSSTLVFQQAGYELGGVDLELSPMQQLIVQLNRLEDVSHAKLRALLDSNKHRKVTHAIIKSLIQAEEMAEQVDLENLVYYKLIVKVGPVPSVRPCWRQENLAAVEVEPVPPVAKSTPASIQTSMLKSFGEGSFFEQRSADKPKPESRAADGAELSRPREAIAESEERVESGTAKAAPAADSVESRRSLSGGKDWGKASLERFKKMPSVSKYQR